MPTASKFPVGFLSLIGAQNFGENPRDVSYNVQPTVDIGENYLVNGLTLLSGSAGAVANGFNNMANIDLVVPVGELWRVYAFNASIAAGAGITGTFGHGVRPAATGPRMQLGDSLDFTASRTVWIAAKNLPLWMPAGYQLGIEIQNLAGGNPTASCQILVSRLTA